MNHRSHVLTRLMLFGMIAGLLIWLGSLKPRVAGTGPAVVTLKQGSNVSFELQNARDSIWRVKLANTLPDDASGKTNNATMK